MGQKAWRIIPRPLLETVLNNHAQHHRVHQPLILHGPRGVGKTTLVLDRLLNEWNKGPHITGYVDLAQSIKSHHPHHGSSYPWASWASVSHDPPQLPTLRAQLEQCLESMVHKAVELGTVSSHQIFTTINKWHGINTALRRVIEGNKGNSVVVSGKVSSAVLWDRAVFALSGRCDVGDVVGKGVSVEEASYFKDAVVALRLAKEVIGMQQRWRANAVRELNRKGGFSRTLASLSTDWPVLLLELLSQSAEIAHFQPKLVINNIEVLKFATLNDDSSVSGPLYHDSLIHRIIGLGANEMCLPIIFLTSDSYYSYRAFIDFGFPDIFISRENFGWTPAEAKLHMVSDYFSSSEWTLVAELLGSNSRHLFELYALKQSNYYQKILDDKGSTFEDILDAYLAYLQITVVNPAIEKALEILQKFAVDAHNGRISKDRLRFGASWRHPPRTDDATRCSEWAKLQLMDFVQALVNTEFGVNYLADCSLEILDDPSAVAMVENSKLYAANFLARDRVMPSSDSPARPFLGWFALCITGSILHSASNPWYSKVSCEMVCAGANANEVLQKTSILVASNHTWPLLSSSDATIRIQEVEIQNNDAEDSKSH